MAEKKEDNRQPTPDQVREKGPRNYERKEDFRESTVTNTRPAPQPRPTDDD